MNHKESRLSVTQRAIYILCITIVRANIYDTVVHRLYLFTSAILIRPPDLGQQQTDTLFVTHLFWATQRE